MELSDGSIAVAIGVVLPFIISFLKDVDWSAKVKQALSFGVGLVFAVGVTAIDNGVSLDTVDEVVANLGVIFTIAQLFYTQILAGTTVNAKLENSGVGAGKLDE